MMRKKPDFVYIHGRDAGKRRAGLNWKEWMTMKTLTVMRLGFLLILVLLIGAGCGVLPGTAPISPPVSNAPPAANFLPAMPGYNRLDAQTVQDFIVGLGETGSVLTGQFEATAAIAVVDRVAECYQNIGAVAAAGYSRADLPIVAGVVAVANRDLLMNPQTFLACVSSAQQQRALLDGQGGGGMQPCGFSYTTEINGETFDFLYAGTDIEICQQFCRSLPNCTGHP
jgi:hypothetical protein